MEESHPTGLAPLSALDDYEVAEGYPDVRGWTLYDESGQGLGEVTDLVVDTVRDQAVYATVALQDPDRFRDLVGPAAEVRVPLAALALDAEARALALTQPLATLVGWGAAGAGDLWREAAPVTGPEPATEDVTVPDVADLGAAGAYALGGADEAARPADSEPPAAADLRGERDVTEQVREESRERGPEDPGTVGC